VMPESRDDEVASKPRSGKDLSLLLVPMANTREERTVVRSRVRLVDDQLAKITLLRQKIEDLQSRKRETSTKTTKDYTL
jgi:hypothetical protein